MPARAAPGCRARRQLHRHRGLLRSDFSEDLIAEALYPYPEDLVIGTKGGLLRTGPGVWPPCGRPEYLRQEVEMSLRRLKLERIDLYQLHRIDPRFRSRTRWVS